jgi:hypothetical protein
MSTDHALRDSGSGPMSPIALFINMLTSPVEAFDELGRRPSKLVPLLLVIGLNALVIFWYFSSLDFDWFVDDTLRNANIPEDQLDQARENMTQMGPAALRVFGILGSSVAILAIYTIQAAYLTQASAIAGYRQKFSQWFSLAAWTGIVVIFAQIGMAVTLALDGNGQLGQYDLDPTTLRNLGIRPDNPALERVLGSINLPMLWSLVLLILGHRRWLGTSLLKSVSIVSTPYLLIFGIWTFVSLG